MGFAAPAEVDPSEPVPLSPTDQFTQRVRHDLAHGVPPLQIESGIIPGSSMVKKIEHCSELFTPDRQAISIALCPTQINHLDFEQMRTKGKS